MDLSKLPKLSDSSQSAPPPPPPEQATPAPQPVAHGAYTRTRTADNLGVLWFNVIVGLILLFLGRSFFSWLMHALTGQPFHTGIEWTPESGNTGEVPYFQLDGFTAWTDTGVFLFGLVILFEAAVLAWDHFRPGGASKLLIYVALFLTVLCTLLNLYVSIRLLGVGLLPILSGFAVAFGGFILASLYTTLRAPSPGSSV